MSSVFGESSTERVVKALLMLFWRGLLKLWFFFDENHASHATVLVRLLTRSAWLERYSLLRTVVPLVGLRADHFFIVVALQDLAKVWILLDVELGEEFVAVLELGRIVGGEAVFRHDFHRILSLVGILHEALGRAWYAACHSQHSFAVIYADHEVVNLIHFSYARVQGKRRSLAHGPNSIMMMLSVKLVPHAVLFFVRERGA